MKRLAPFALLTMLVACGLESSGQAPSDAGIDRGTGVTDSGMRCGCFPKIDGDWKYVALLRDGTLTCDGAWAAPSPRVTVEATGDPATCGCTCSAATSPTCTVTGESVTAYANANCSGGPDKAINGNAACFDVNPDYNPTGTISVKGTATVTAAGGTCSPPAATTTIPPLEVHTGSACPFVGELGGGCSASSACVPDPAPGAIVCVARDVADAECPLGYPNKHRVGTAFTDGRTCGTCSCASTSTCNVDGQFFNDNGTCAGNKKEGQPFALDGACHVATNNGVAGHSLGTVAIGAQKCVAQGFEPTGAIVHANELTICCP